MAIYKDQVTCFKKLEKKLTKLTTQVCFIDIAKLTRRRLTINL